MREVCTYGAQCEGSLLAFCVCLLYQHLLLTQTDRKKERKKDHYTCVIGMNALEQIKVMFSLSDTAIRLEDKYLHCKDYLLPLQS